MLMYSVYTPLSRPFPPCAASLDQDREQVLKQKSCRNYTFNVAGRRTMSKTQHLKSQIPAEMAGRRLDQVLAELFPDYSRARLQQWVKEGQVSVNAAQWRSRDKVQGGECVEINAVAEEQTRWEAQPISLEVVYEDAALLVINKPAGLVVHPGAGNSEGTLLNALLHYAPELANVPRAGIVHRLDKDTSGLLVIARTLPAQKHLVEQLQARTIERE